MCGICGFTRIQNRNQLRAMCDAMIHRGPDSEGFYEDDTVSLGVRRLRIVDLVTGDQPVHNEDSTVWVVLNGEVYNFKELRVTLQEGGHEFYTQSDTEVLVHLYEDFGEEMVRQLSGMFAFALWDTVRKKLVLVRDRFGKKPLYYSLFSGSLVFASELKALLTLEELPRVINRRAVAHYLTYLYNPMSESFLSSIYRVPPATMLVWKEESNHFILREYWDLPTELAEISERGALTALGRLLKHAVSIRLRGDVPLGALLSGGVDSSIVVGIAAQMKQDLKTFTIGFDGFSNEFTYAREMADKFQTDHHEYSIGQEPLEYFPELVRTLDEPVADSSIIPAFLVAKEVRKHVTACLTGDGGDELCWGYPWLQPNDSLESWFKLPTTVRKPIRQVASRLVSEYARGLRDLERYENLGYPHLEGIMKCIVRMSHMSQIEVQQALSEKYDTIDLFKRIAQKSKPLDRSKAYLTIKTVLPNDFLHKADRTSMAHSLELRSPLLDHTLAESAWTWPSNLKISRGQPKYLLKLFAFRELGVPKNIIYRKKQGFSIPYESWYEGAREILANHRQLLREIISEDTIDAVCRSKLSYEAAHRVFALAVLATWLGETQATLESSRNAPPVGIPAL
jgi:asparagine synthase (glutamine-hydrolysing)